MKTNIVSGASVAAAAIALAVGGMAAAPAFAKSAPVHCAGVNACKTANSACKGQNACKGQGWLPEKSAKACEAKGGSVAEM